MYKQIIIMVRVLVNESESLECTIIKNQIHQCSPSWMQNQAFKNKRVFRNNTFTRTHRRTGNLLSGGGGGAVNHLPKKILQVAQIFTKELKRNEGHITTT